jgi:hypothetical protein
MTQRGRPPKEPGPIGQPTKCTKKLIAKICTAISAGAYLETAAAFGGITKQTLHNWLRRGARDEGDKKRSIFREFNDAVGFALAESEMTDLATISLHAQGFRADREVVEITKDAEGNQTEKRIHETRFRRDWQAAAWRLERKHPGRWGRRLGVRGEMEGEDGSISGVGGFHLKMVKMPERDKLPARGGVVDVGVTGDISGIDVDAIDEGGNGSQ